MRPAPVFLDRLRAGEEPGADELTEFIEGLSSGRVSDAQAGAFAMAVCWHGLSPSGRAVLTKAMVASGERLPRRSDKPRLDKHSTGGLGDSVSLVLAPALAAIGAEVPMISGRALGHTGGTLDKLEALPGLSTELGMAGIERVLAEAGCVIAAAGPEIAPADARLYALRDQTGTVASPALITASILSKKLAASLDALVLDIKAGSGAFMTDPNEAADLARGLVDIAGRCGLSARALVTAMDQPLLPAIGDGPEMALCLSILRGEATAARFQDLVLRLGASVAHQAGLGPEAELRDALAQAVHSGRAFERFSQMARAMGARGAFRADDITAAPVTFDLCSPEAGVLQRIDGQALGLAARRLGGRGAPGIGLSQIAPLGAPLDAGMPLARLHAASRECLTDALPTIRSSFHLAAPGAEVTSLPLVVEHVEGPKRDC